MPATANVIEGSSPRRPVLFDSASGTTVELLTTGGKPYKMTFFDGVPANVVFGRSGYAGWSNRRIDSAKMTVETIQPEPIATLVFHRAISDPETLRAGEILIEHEDGNLCATEATSLNSVPETEEALLEEARERLKVFLA